MSSGAEDRVQAIVSGGFSAAEIENVRCGALGGRPADRARRSLDLLGDRAVLLRRHHDLDGDRGGILLVVLERVEALVVRPRGRVTGLAALVDDDVDGHGRGEGLVVDLDVRVGGLVGGAEARLVRDLELYRFDRLRADGAERPVAVERVHDDLEGNPGGGECERHHEPRVGDELLTGGPCIDELHLGRLCNLGADQRVLELSGLRRAGPGDTCRLRTCDLELHHHELGVHVDGRGDVVLEETERQDRGRRASVLHQLGSRRRRCEMFELQGPGRPEPGAREAKREGAQRLITREGGDPDLRASRVVSITATSVIGPGVRSAALPSCSSAAADLATVASSTEGSTSPSS